MISPAQVTSSDWNEDLRAFVAAKRAEQPIPIQRTELTDAENAQRVEIGKSICAWLVNKQLTPILMFRHSHRATYDFDRQPTVVVTTSLPGLVAAKEIFRDSVAVVYLLQHEYEEWTKVNPDNLQLLHVHIWSYFLPASRMGESEILAKGRQIHPDTNLSDFYVLHFGHYSGARFGEEVRTLWRLRGNRLHEVEGLAHSIVY